MKINFYGAAEEVTGSKHVITLNDDRKILLDCGLFQGRGRESYKKNRHWDFSPEAIDFTILSHAHIDHSGLLPALVKKGYKGQIYCTPATFDMCKIMLTDSAYIQMSEVDYINKKWGSPNTPPLEPLYTIDDLDEVWPRFVPVPYGEIFEIAEGIKLQFTDAGHILGSAVVNLTLNEQKKKHRLCYTGDIGRYINKILPHPQPAPQADTIICEATYGDRLHESVKDAGRKLEQIVHETCVVNKGKLIIPAFSIGKTQELVYTLNKLQHKGKLPPIKVFVDSPLAISATEIMKKHPECFGKSMREFMLKDDDPFGFENLHYTREVELSKAISNSQQPCIVISASGMAEAGRIKHHLSAGLENARNAVLIIGYCEPATLAGRLLKGDEEVTIYGVMHKVKASVHRIDFFSAHADYDELFKFFYSQDLDKVKNVFLVHGSKSALYSLHDKMEAKGIDNVKVVRAGATYHV